MHTTNILGWLSWLIPAALCTVMFGQLFFSAVNYRKPLMKRRTFYAGYRYFEVA